MPERLPDAVKIESADAKKKDQSEDEGMTDRTSKSALGD
jgi:hypothetical protein